MLYLALLSLLALCSSIPTDYPPFVLVNMNLSVDPCQDFFMYSCGGWINRTQIPPEDAVIYRAITSIESMNDALLTQIVQNSTNVKVQLLYADCMDRPTIDKLGFSALKPYYDYISNIQTVDQFMWGVGFLQSYEIPALFTMSVVSDGMNPSMAIAELDQGGYLLPREIYTSSDPLLAMYQDHISKMFQLAGDNVTTAAQKSSLVVTFEGLLANNSLPLDQIRDPLQTYHKFDLKGLEQLTPHLNWDAFLTGLYQPNASVFNVAEPSFFKALDQLVPQHIEMLTAYLQWNLLHFNADYLSQDFVNESFNFFGKIFNGQTEMASLSSRCVSTISNFLGDILAQDFVAKAFSPAAMELSNTMIGLIEQAFNNLLVGLEWMDDITRQQAIIKLYDVVRRVGHPDTYKTYDTFFPVPGQYLSSAMEARALDFALAARQIGGSFDRSAWEMFAFTVNAYYEPTSNSINFPAGILQNPYFDPTYTDVSMNFGGAGMIMGHELTHGFDDQGRMYDGTGKLNNWWQNATADKFVAKAQCLANQYSQFQILPNVNVNGNLTLGENIADNGGIKNALNAYKLYMQDANLNLPLFFVSYAQGWCAKATDQYWKDMVETNVHSPPKFRVMGPLMNLQEFSDTFQCQPGSVMNPIQKCQVW